MYYNCINDVNRFSDSLGEIMKIKEKKAIKLIPLLIILVCGILYNNYNKKSVKKTYYDEQVLAAEKMEVLSNKIKDYKISMGIPIYDYDYFQTGLLGDEFNIYTTSIGYLPSKRTTTNPDMAALVVDMFKEIGLEENDRVAVGFSGSFPGLNIAVISAGEIMNLDLIIISSFGSSTYGANQEKLSFPKMLNILNSENLTIYNSQMVTLGGDYDVAYGKPDDIMEPIIEEYKNMNLNLMVEKDFEKNIQKKINLYYQKGNIDAYIAVGGNITFLGNNEGNFSNKQGILKRSKINPSSFREGDGLIKYFLSKNIPTIHLLNIKKIVSDYGLNFDPSVWQNIGESKIYYKIEYNKKISVILLIITLMYLVYENRERFKNG